MGKLLEVGGKGIIVVRNRLRHEQESALLHD